MREFINVFQMLLGKEGGGAEGGGECQFVNLLFVQCVFILCGQPAEVPHIQTSDTLLLIFISCETVIHSSGWASIGILML